MSLFTLSTMESNSGGKKGKESCGQAWTSWEKVPWRVDNEKYETEKMCLGDKDWVSWDTVSAVRSVWDWECTVKVP